MRIAGKLREHMYMADLATVCALRAVCSAVIGGHARGNGQPREPGIYCEGGQRGGAASRGRKMKAVGGLRASPTRSAMFARTMQARARCG